jgi:phage baseplate assembly protein W
MSFGAKKIFPIDKKPRVAVGVSLPFTSPGVFASTYTTREAIKNNLINFFLTGTGQRYLNPLFGAGLQTYIFEQLNSKTEVALEQDIQSIINEFFPSVIINDLEITSQPDTLQITVKLTYSIQDTGITDNLEIAFN